jgi:hypothetical protein
MNLSRRAAWLLLLLGVGLFLGFLFRAFIVTNVVVPIAMLLLLFWRLLLSIHQAVYWGLVAGLAMGLGFYRLVQVVGREEERSTPISDSALQVVDYWRLSLQLSSNEGPNATILKRELSHKLVAIYAMKQPEVDPFTIHEALRLRQLPLPDTIHSFLFSNEVQETKLSWRQQLQRLADKPRKWLRHWTGRDKAEYYQAMEETITFMEALLEIKHGDEYFAPPAPDH